MEKTQKSPDSQKRPPPNVHIDNRQKALPIKKRTVSTIVKELLSFLQVRCEEISVYFVTEKKIAELHDQFFQDPTITDCISFPIDDKHLGEIFVCPAVAIAYAKKHNLDPWDETLLYLVHGILHLIGYDDLDPKSKKIMRKMEKKCLRHISSALVPPQKHPKRLN